MKMRPDGLIPRRSDLTLNVPAEMAIREAIRRVEEHGCHPLLTEAVMNLLAAFDKVADFIELEVPSETPSANIVVGKEALDA